MTKINIVTTYRNRIATAALSRHLRKKGNNMIVVKMRNGANKLLTVDIDVFTRLLSHFENTCVGEFGIIEGRQVVINAYQQSLDVNAKGEHLTEEGKTLIDELIKEMIDFARDNSHLMRDKK
jgi:hypothetical protein